MVEDLLTRRGGDAISNCPPGKQKSRFVVEQLEGPVGLLHVGVQFESKLSGDDGVPDSAMPAGEGNFPLEGC